jgi:hypothetical protein
MAEQRDDPAHTEWSYLLLITLPGFACPDSRFYGQVKPTAVVNATRLPGVIATTHRTCTLVCF